MKHLWNNPGMSNKRGDTTIIFQTGTRFVGAGLLNKGEDGGETRTDIHFNPTWLFPYRVHWYTRLDEAWVRHKTKRRRTRNAALKTAERLSAKEP